MFVYGGCNAGCRCLCFFFKQNTAYEMRISDWSSDVCSSDLLARLDRLGTAREIAQIASTIGREFGFQLLQEVSGVPESEVRTALSDLVCAGLIVPKDAVDGSIYVFRHALLQQRSEERRVGKECVSTCRYRWSTSTEKKKIYKTNKNKKN